MEATEGQDPAVEEALMSQQEEVEQQQHQMLDEQSLQQLMDSGTVGEDSIIAIVHNEHGEPQTVVLSRADAEALGIQLDQPSVPMTEQVEEPPAMTGLDEGAGLEPPQMEQLEEPPPALPQVEPEQPPQEVAPEVEPIQPAPPMELPVPPQAPEEPQPAKQEEDEVTTVSLDALPKPEAPTAPSSSSNDVLSNIIQSLFNPNEPNQSNVSIVPRMVGGKRKLCLRLPASTASALLAQTGAAGISGGTSSGSLDGGVPKKIKIVIPPSGQATVVQHQTSQQPVQQKKPAQIIKVPMRAGPARLPEETSPVRGGSGAPSSKPFLASLFTSSAGTTTMTSTTTTTSTASPISSPARPVPAAQTATKTGLKPLGSTENPIQLVQEGNSFRSLQPLTPEQLKHIASVLKQNRQAILAGSPDGHAGGTGSDKRKVVYDAASNTRIVYRVVTPGELKKTSATAGASSATTITPVAKKIAPAAATTSTTTTTTTTPSGRGRGRGRGRPPRGSFGFQSSASGRGRPSPDETDSESDAEMLEDLAEHQDGGSSSRAAAAEESMTKEEREGKKKILPRTRSGRVSKPPRHMVKDYKRLHHLDFAQPDLDDSDGGYSDYRIDQDGVKREATSSASGPGADHIPTSPFHCATCKREYTTPHRLTRHFEQFPDHSATAAANGGDGPLPPRRAAMAAKNGGGSGGGGGRVAGEEHTTDEPESSSPPSTPPARRGAGRGRGGWRGGPRGRAAGRGRGGRVGRPPAQHSPAFLAERRKLKLAEALEHCADEEVVEVAGPRLSAAMSSWDYLLLRVQQEEEGHSSAPLIPRILNELMTMAAKVSAAITPHLRTNRTEGDVAYELNSGRTAGLLELPIGTYYVSKEDDRHLLVGQVPEDQQQDALEAEEEEPVVQVQPPAQPPPPPPPAPAPPAQPIEESEPQEPEVKSKELWEELEEASQSLHPGSERPIDHDGMTDHGGDDGGPMTGSDAELMQVDDIVNQVVEDQTGSKAPSPL